MKCMIVILMITALVAALSCGPFSLFQCENHILFESSSPNMAYKAVVFSRDCGATSSLSTHLSIVRKSKKLPNNYGNVFQCDTNHGKTPYIPGQGAHIEIKWLSEDELLVVYDPNCRVYEKELNYKGIRIKYETHSWTEEELMKMKSKP
ncbi:MAG TPA: hypothetical protein PK747_09520 [Acidobacteriota bacterium]|nr:hypothetical protein [Acidobacteriota bacterium]HNT18572.1 hypothetical protein [Acidobacteriota bacterium]HPA27759.1 hypothetical protein [Acidobacteriota bacterium]HQO20867.1 hypothetical protein [Acidobacteriota bacterium]HQQ47630.1 hypothetical protein [Acidobacteriota bacterium]